jgi:iron complex outermembrane receptor protein
MPKPKNPIQQKTYVMPSIEVSTNKAEERKSPVPFAEISEVDIENRYTTGDLPKLMRELPSIISYSENGNYVGYTNLTMRGFNQRRISVMINGIPQNDPEDHNFYWINVNNIAPSLGEIQVQRGAGLSNYGSAAIAGTIYLTTSNFANDPGVRVSSGLGYQEFGAARKESGQQVSKFQIEASSGMVGNYAVYGKFGRINSFGYRDQSYATLNSYFLSAARFDENFSTQINIYGGSQNDGLAYTGLPKAYVDDEELRLENYNYWSYDSTGNNVNWTTDRRPQEVEQFSQPQIEILNDWDINDKLSLKSALFYKRGEGYFDFDGTGWTTKESYFLTEENGFPGAEDPRNPIIRAFVGNDYWGWIPRLVYDHGDGELLVGVEMRFNKSDRWGKLQFAENYPENFNPDYKFYSHNGTREIFSIFASEKYNVTEKLSLSAEGQLVYHSYGIENEQLGGNFTEYNTSAGETVGNGDPIFDIKYLFFNPRVGANYNIDNFHNVYGMAAYTSREPRMRNLYAAEDAYFGATPLFEKEGDAGNTRYDFDNPLVEPEKMFNIEAGYSFRSAKYYANANFYWMEYFDELVSSGQLDIFGAPIDGNAPRTRHFGLELQASALLLASDYGNISLGGNATFSQNEIIEYDFATNTGETVSLEGNSIAGFPDFMANLRLTYEVTGLYASVHMHHVGGFYTDNFGDMITGDPRIFEHLNLFGEYYADNKLDSYTVFNADVNYRFEKIPGFQSLTLKAQVTNLTNLLYAGGAVGRNFFPAAERMIFLRAEVEL